MPKLTCPNCGNDKGWRNARQSSGTQTATCGRCGETVTSHGGVVMREVRGDMRQDRR